MVNIVATPLSVNDFLRYRFNTLDTCISAVLALLGRGNVLFTTSRSS